MAEDMPQQYAQAYKDAVDNLIYLKREQFQVTYFTWLLLAALYILSGKASPNARSFLEMGAGLVGLFSVGTLLSFHRSMSGFRKRLRAIYDKFFDKPDHATFVLNAEDHYHVVGLLIAACLVASGFTIYLIETIPNP